MVLRHFSYGGALLVVIVAGCTVTTGTTGNCSPDSTVTGCTGTSIGYSCTGGETPVASNASLNCSVGVAGNGGSMRYCCEPETALSTCASDTTVTSCPAGSTGYSCTASDNPSQSNPSLTCGSGTAGNAGATLYCCTGGGADAGGSCSPSTGPSTCTGNATEYQCTGSALPTQTNPSLTCGPGIAGSSGGALYCCATVDAATSTGSCVQDSTVQNCAINSTGYSCTGGVMPVQSNPSLTCGPGTTTTSGVTAYCCGTNTTAADAGADVAPDSGTCAVAAVTGSTSCDQCLTGKCCSQLVTCDTPDSAGLNDAGASACEQLLGCILDCVAGNADAGVPAGTRADCQMVCNPSYTSTEQQSASAVLDCQMSNCSSSCQ